MHILEEKLSNVDVTADQLNAALACVAALLELPGTNADRRDAIDGAIDFAETLIHNLKSLRKSLKA